MELSSLAVLLYNTVQTIITLFQSTTEDLRIAVLYTVL